MVIYRDAVEQLAPRALLAQLERQAAPPIDHAAAVALLIDLGALEAALLDQIHAACDRPGPERTVLDAALLAAAQLLRAAWNRDCDAAAGAALRRAIARLGRLPWPQRLTLKVPEGYAYYGLYPECYLAAAAELHRQLRPQRALAIGLRGIGTGLCALVAAELLARGCAATRLTLRPHGHPFDRRPQLADGLRAALAADRDRLFILTDEGPGLSGSSLCGCAEALLELGVPEERIVLLPAWDPEPAAFNNPRARGRWRRHLRIVVPFEAVWLASGRLDGAPLRALGAGLWRDHLPPGVAHPAVQPQHERRKLLRGDGRLLRFVGLGRYGEARRRRAERLAASGFGPPVEGLRHGFLAQPWLPLTPPAAATPALLEQGVRYLAALPRAFATGAAVAPEPLVAMVESNVAALLGRDRLPRRLRPPAAPRPALQVDGRLALHEWLVTPRGIIKCDGLDHGDDHFFPGPTDIAWDLAGAAVEWRLGRRARNHLQERFIRLTGDSGLREALPFHRVAYLAFRAAYTATAAGSLAGSADGVRFLRLARRYRRLLALELARWPP